MTGPCNGRGHCRRNEAMTNRRRNGVWIGAPGAGGEGSFPACYIDEEGLLRADPRIIQDRATGIRRLAAGESRVSIEP